MKDECLCDDCDYATCLCKVCRSRKTCTGEGSCGMIPEKPKKLSIKKEKTTIERTAPKQINCDSERPLTIGDFKITLRDYFAGQALAGLGAFYANQDNMEILDVVEQCYGFADAMLAKRKKTNES